MDYKTLMLRMLWCFVILNDDWMVKHDLSGNLAFNIYPYLRDHGWQSCANIFCTTELCTVAPTVHGCSAKTLIIIIIIILRDELYSH